MSDLTSRRPLVFAHGADEVSSKQLVRLRRESMIYA